MKQSGFVLLTVLIFMQVFSLLSVFGLITASANIKRNEHVWNGFIYSLRENKVLKQKELLAGKTTSCIIPVTPTPVLALKPVAWWQANTCSENIGEIRYYYAFESLGDDTCGIMGKGKNNQYLIARYYRITLCMLPDKLKGAKYLIQSTVAVPVPQTVSCEQILHTIKPGRQMWREI